MYAVIGLAFCLLLGAMIGVQGISALLWTPVGFAFGLFSAAQMILPLMLALPRAIWLVTKRQMRTAVFGRILITPLIWLVGLFVISFLIVFLSPSTAKFLSNNIPLNLGTSLGWVAIILSPLSAKGRSDFVADFDKAYQEFYIGREAQRDEGNMGFKNWLAGTIAGPKSYGGMMGREAGLGGLALANVVFISHGSRSIGGETAIFDTRAEMEAAGYKPRFTEIIKIDLDLLTKDEELLFRSLQTAMISFAFIVIWNAALQLMRRENASKFRNGLVPSLLRSMVKCGLFDRIETARTEMLPYGNSYANRATSASASTVLNMDRPGSGDILEEFIVRAVSVSGSTLHYGFTRTGLTGFDLIAVPLMEEAVKSIHGAVKKYNW